MLVQPVRRLARALSRAVVLLVACTVHLVSVPPRPLDAQCDDCVFPDAEWDYLRGPALASFGWDPAALRAVTRHLVDASNSTGVVVVDRGRVVYTFGDVEELSYLASVRKSLLAMLYGAWVGKRYHRPRLDVGGHRRG